MSGRLPFQSAVDNLLSSTSIEENTDGIEDSFTSETEDNADLDRTILVLGWLNSLEEILSVVWTMIKNSWYIALHQSS
jgi:hypothetical protein